MAQSVALRRPFLADLLRRSDASLTTQVVGVVAFAALAALGAQARVYLWEVPITMQTLAVYGAGLVIGGRNGFLAMALYLAVGLVLPVFAGAGQGLSYFASAPSAGYLLAYPLVALLVGALTEQRRTFVASGLAVLAGSVLLFTVGVTWLHFAAGHTTWTESIVKGWLMFVIWDMAKVWLVAGGFAGLRKITGA